MVRHTLLERAFILAKSGDCRTLTDVRSALKKEGYRVCELEGPSLRRQLKTLCVASRKPDDS
jgi:hypothetical protein